MMGLEIGIDIGGTFTDAVCRAPDDVQAIAICFLFAFLNPAHGRRAREIVQANGPGIAVSLSCEVDPVIREYERTCATVFDAALKPVLDAYLGRIETLLTQRDIAAPLQVMHSRGGQLLHRSALGPDPGDLRQPSVGHGPDPGRRPPTLPDVPTMAEAGIADFVVVSWVGPFGPANMPPAVVAQLSRAFTEAAMSPLGLERLRGLGAVPNAEDAAAFDASWRRDMARWRQVVADARVPDED